MRKSFWFELKAHFLPLPNETVFVYRVPRYVAPNLYRKPWTLEICVKWRMILAFMQLRSQVTGSNGPVQVLNCFSKKPEKKIQDLNGAVWTYDLAIPVRCSNQLHKLRSQLRWSSFTWFHFRSSNMIYFIYIIHRNMCVAKENQIRYKMVQPQPVTSITFTVSGFFSCGFTTHLIGWKTNIPEIILSVHGYSSYRISFPDVSPLRASSFRWRLYDQGHLRRI